METYERVRHLRKNLKLSQEKFGAALGVNRDVINNIELDRLARPEQKEPLLRLICETFNVNYMWLTAGQGEMQTETKQSFLQKISNEYGLSLIAQKIIDSYLELGEDQRTVIDGFFQNVANSLSNNKDENSISEIIDNVIGVYKAPDIKTSGRGYSNVSETITKEEEDELSALHAKLEEEFFKEKKRELEASFVKELDVG